MKTISACLNGTGSLCSGAPRGPRSPEKTTTRFGAVFLDGHLDTDRADHVTGLNATHHDSRRDLGWLIVLKRPVKRLQFIDFFQLVKNFQRRQALPLAPCDSPWTTSPFCKWAASRSSRSVNSMVAGVA